MEIELFFGYGDLIEYRLGGRSSGDQERPFATAGVLRTATSTARDTPNALSATRTFS
jgi:hypothetical protein